MSKRVFPREPVVLKKAAAKLYAEIEILEKEINRLEILLNRAEKKLDLRERKLSYLEGEENTFWLLLTRKREPARAALEGKE